MSRFSKLSLILMTLFLAVLVGLASAPIASAAGPTAQTGPIEGSIFPALLQVALIVLVTEGIKSLGKAFGLLQLEGREAAVAYIVVGLGIYLIQSFLLPALPSASQEALTNILAVLATLLAGSGLFSMTSSFRIQASK